MKRKKLFRIIKRVALLFFVLVFIFLLYMFRQDFSKSDRQLVRTFYNKGVTLSVHHIPYKGDSIRYIGSGQRNERFPLLVFIHGAPGGCDAFNGFLQDSVLISKYRMVSVDRLGYGMSHYGKAEVSIEQQAKMVAHVMDQYMHPEIILIGHSFGGPIAMSGALERMEKVKGVILMAPAIDPEQEKMFWFSSIPIKPVLNLLFSQSFQVSAHEKLGHRQALEEVMADWVQLQQPILHIHGKKDRLVPFGNVEFTRNLKASAPRTIHELETSGHLIPWTKTREMCRFIDEFVQSL